MAILILWVAIFTIAVAIPPDWYGDAFFMPIRFTSPIMNQSVQLPINDGPFINYTIRVTMRTVGGWSVYNLIDVNATVMTGDNFVNLTDYFTAIAFTNTSFVAKTPLTLQPVLVDQKGGGVWKVSGTISPDVVGPIWVGLVQTPTTPWTRSVLAHLRTFPDLEIQVQPYSDTLSLQLNELVLKTGFIFASFSVLFLQPIINDIRLNDDSK